MIPDSTEIARDARALRRRAFVDAAREAFFMYGYGATTMSAIAAKVGGSKTTLWSYFPAKQDLFAAVVDDIVERYSPAASVPFEPDEPVETVMRRVGAAVMETILSEHILALHRIVTGEALRFPELGAMFYERGPRRGKERLAGFIAAAMADGRLRQGDAMVAARQFSGMLHSGCFQETLLGIDGYRHAAMVARDVDAAVDSFLRAWQAD